MSEDKSQKFEKKRSNSRDTRETSQYSAFGRRDKQGFGRESGQRVSSQKIYTTPDRRREISPHTSVDLKKKLERLLEDPSRLSEKDTISILSKFVKHKEKKALAGRRFSGLIRKYKAAIERYYVRLAAADDVKNYCSATPRQLSGRSDEIRLETMERLFWKVEKGELPRKKFREIRNKYFPDVISKDNLPDAQVTKMLRCVAAGKFYAPKDNSGKFDEWALSSVYQEVRYRKPKGKKYLPQDYDLFGVDENGQPLSPTFNAVQGSTNFCKMKNVIVAKLSEMGISPEEAYQLNVADIAHILQPVKGGAKDISFNEVAAGIVDSPYQEFSKKLGLVLKMGGASKLSNKEQEKVWLNHFATASEKEDFNDYGDRSGLNIFLSYSERLYEKLSEDFRENDVSDGFIDAWAESLYCNKSVNPKLVKGFARIPYKIDIHHWERLSAADEDEIAADKNNLSNLGVMLQYSESDVDIHAEQHRGESAHFVTSNFMERQRPNIHLICTSSHAVFSCPPEYFAGRKDKNENLEKIERVRANISKNSKEEHIADKTDLPQASQTGQTVSVVKVKKETVRA